VAGGLTLVRVALGGPVTWLEGPDMTSKFTELAIDCADPGGLARFWCSVLDYEVQGEDDGVVTIGSPKVPEGKNRLGPVPPVLTFAHVPEGKTVKNRVHLDVNPTDGEQDEEIARLVGLGATVVYDNRPEFSWVTLTDPEGNEFDVLAGRCP
jgi:Glyoxalase-like domain